MFVLYVYDSTSLRTSKIGSGKLEKNEALLSKNGQNAKQRQNVPQQTTVWLMYIHTFLYESLNHYCSK